MAMIRSTPEETKPLVMVAQVAESPCAFWKSKVTLSPKAAVRASSKPWVAASRAACCTNWQMPTVNFWPSAAAETEAAVEEATEEAAAEEAEEPPQADRAAAAPQAAAVVFEQATGWQVWGAVLIGYIASLFGAIVIPAKKYQ